MKILYVVSDLASGGAQIALRRFLEVLDREKFSPYVISLSGGGEQADYIRSLGIDVQAFDMRCFFSMAPSFLKFLRAVKEINPDIIHGWMYHGNAAAILAGSVCPKAGILWSIRCSDFDLSKYGLMTKIAFFINRKFSSSPAKIIYNSNAGKKYHEENGFCQEKSIVIQNGVDTEYFIPAPEKKNELRSKYGIATGVRLIGMASRYDPMKDFDTLFGAFAAVRAASASAVGAVNPDTALILCGKGIDDSNTALSAMVQKYGVKDGVIFAGHIKEMNEFYPLLDVFVLSSKSEGFPNVLAEASACGVPALSTRCGDADEIIGSEKTVPAGDTALMAEKILKILKFGREETAIETAKAVCLMREKFNTVSEAKKFERVYGEIANGENKNGQAI